MVKRNSFYVSWYSLTDLSWRRIGLVNIFKEGVTLDSFRLRLKIGMQKFLKNCRKLMKTDVKGNYWIRF